MIGQTIHRTGDINLAACCLSIGIPPCFPEPVEVMQSSDGRDYHSFKLEAVSICGKYNVGDMSNAWSNSSILHSQNPSHPFLIVSSFSRFSKGCRNKNDFIESAADYLTIPADTVRKALKSIGELEVNSPESPITYVCCYILNRFALISWAKSSIPKDVAFIGKSAVLLDGKLSLQKKKYLMSHL